MSAKKYEIVKNKSIVYDGKTLYHIRALRDFITVNGRKVKKGDLGGYVESENNLSQERYCWIHDNAKVYGNAKILDDAIVNDSACVFNSAVVCGAAEIYDYAFIFDNTKVFGDAKIFGNAWLFGTAKIGDKLSLNKGEYIFKSLDVDETLNEIKSICYKISFAVRAIELKFPIEQKYIESIVSQFAEYSELADSIGFTSEFIGFTSKKKEIVAMLSQCKKDVKILKK